MTKCEFCKKNKATESITDAETGREVLICVSCDSKMNWTNTDLQRVRKEDLVIALEELNKIKIVLGNTISFLESKSD